MNEAMREAVEQSRLAYEFAPGSYTHSAFAACLRAQQEVDDLLVALKAIVAHAFPELRIEKK